VALARACVPVEQFFFSCGPLFVGFLRSWSTALVFVLVHSFRLSLCLRGLLLTVALLVRMFISCVDTRLLHDTCCTDGCEVPQEPEVCS